MRFRYKRPKIDEVGDELSTLMDVMCSDLFIFIDLLLYSLIFTLFLTPILHTLTVSVLFFGSCYIFFLSVYIFIFKPLWKN
ncbi:MAG TPA: hypothetical protein VGI04_06805 [Neobacillus sp.]